MLSVGVVSSGRQIFWSHAVPLELVDRRCRSRRRHALGGVRGKRYDVTGGAAGLGRARRWSLGSARWATNALSTA